MKITEMRDALNEQNVKKGLPKLDEKFPDWVVRGIWEKRNNLPVTPLPAEVRKKLKSFAELNIISHSETRGAKAARLMAEINAQTNADTEAVLRLKAQAAMFLL